MKTSIILGDQGILTALLTKHRDRKLVHFASAEKAYLYQLDHPGDVDSYVLDAGSLGSDELPGTIGNITFLNELVRILIFTGHDGASHKQPEKENINYCSSLEDVSEHLMGISGGHRKFSRVRWPVAVVFWEKGRPETRKNGSIISISSGGCLISSDVSPEIDTTLTMTIIFKNFDFLAEGVVVRREEGNFAVSLRNITSQTQGIIQEIINERILVELKGIH